MTDDLERVKSIAELGLMEAPLHEAGRHVSLDEDQARLVIELDDDEGRARRLTIAMVPFGEPGESALRMIRFDVTFPFTADDDTKDDVALAIPVISAELAIGGFAADADGSLHLRYTLAADAVSLVADEALVELVELLDFQQERFGDYLEGVCTGDVAVEVLPQVISAAES